MSVSQRLGAFLRKYKFYYLCGISGQRQAGLGDGRWEPRDVWFPDLPQPSEDSLNTKHSQGQSKGNSPGGCNSAIFKLPIRMSKITWLDLPHPLQDNHTLLSWSFKPSVFQAPDQNILKDHFLAAWGPKPTCGSACFLLGMIFLGYSST